MPHIPSRRDVIKLLGAAPFVASRGLEAATSVQAAAAARTRLCLVSRHLQWTNMEEAVAVAAEAGCKAIAWTVRQGAHMVPADVERDLPKAVDLAHKAGLDTPMLITALNVKSSTESSEISTPAAGMASQNRPCDFRFFPCGVVMSDRTWVSVKPTTSASAGGMNAGDVGKVGASLLSPPSWNWKPG